MTDQAREVLDAEWRTIPGFEGMYEISEHGDLRALFSYRGISGPRTLKPFPKNKRGHMMIRLSGQRPFSIHYLVALAFIGPRPEGLFVRHLDDDPLNNHYSNLKYGTHSENEQDKVKNGRHNNAKKTHCKWGHSFLEHGSAKNVIINGKERVHRTCKACQRLRRKKKRGLR